MARTVRMGIDVGGTHTKAVAIDNATQEIIGKSSVKTTHDDEKGVAAGVDGLFMETHPDPATAMSDGANMLRLPLMEDLLRQLLPIREAVKSF